MPLDDSLCGGKSDAGAGIFRDCMQALEGRENLFGIFHIEPYAVVLYKKYLFSVQCSEFRVLN